VSSSNASRTSLSERNSPKNFSSLRRATSNVERISRNSSFSSSKSLATLASIWARRIARCPLSRNSSLEKSPEATRGFHFLVIFPHPLPCFRHAPE